MQRDLELHDTAYKSHFQHKTGDGTQCFSDLERFGKKMDEYKTKECGAGGQWRLESYERKSLDALGEEVVENVEFRAPAENSSDSESE